jgi:PIN domain nuclease of toxin-antitoxin system
MRLLLDAHALLWWLADDPALSRDARDLIADPTNEVIVSAATVWEIAIKRAIGKLDAPDGLAAALERSGFIEAPVTAADAERAGGLEAIHRDPFDRMMVAQAGRLRAIVVTRDPIFVLYGTETVPA